MLVARVGIGDSRILKRGGLDAKTPKGIVSKRVLERTSVVTPSVRKSTQFLTAKKKVEAKKVKETDSTLKTMMHRMNKGKQRDGLCTVLFERN